MSPSTSIDRQSRELAGDQFRLAFHGAVLRLIDQLSADGVMAEFPFLEQYLQEAREIAGVPLEPGPLAAQWREATAHAFRHLQAAAGLDEDALAMLFTVGLIEEDQRFAPILDWAQPSAQTSSSAQGRATMALLMAWWRTEEDCTAVRGNIRRLRELGLIQIVNPDAPRLQWAFQVTPLLWDTLRGEALSGVSDWLEYSPACSLPLLPSQILPADVAAKAQLVPALIVSGETSAIVVRGALHNGRKTLLRGIARAAGLSILDIRAVLKPGDERCGWLGTLATILRALPVFTYELGPGDTAPTPELSGYHGPVGIACSRFGTLTGSSLDRAIAFDLPIPDAFARHKLWIAALGSPDAPEWVDRLRLTSGGIFRSAALGRSQARLSGRSTIVEADVREGTRALQQPLESQAIRLKACGGWDQVVVAADTQAELRSLEARCRFRETLPGSVGAALASSVNHGVRALLSGPSGTGKTLAARVLAAELQLDLYRLDLSALVNKYIGETEKNLNQVLSRAEEFNVVLLLDEGDALLTNRTAVQSSNDRYANLETNFLLQRIETFEGILLITTNALGRIDSAFQRRMDAMVEFRLPEPEERWRLWRVHLPPDHQVPENWLQEAALRCVLSGGQIRNAVLHATLLALDRCSVVCIADVDEAVQREYRKNGAVCPLRRGAGR